MKSFPKSYLRCFLIRIRLSKSIDDRRNPSAAIEAHLARCRRCREWHALELRLIRRLREEAPALMSAPTASVRDRVMNSLAEAPAAASVSRPRWVWAAGAAAIFLIFGVSVFWFQESTPDSAHALDRTPQASVSVVSPDLHDEPGMEYVREFERLIADGRATARFVLSSLPIDDDFYLQAGDPAVGLP